MHNHTKGPYVVKGPSKDYGYMIDTENGTPVAATLFDGKEYEATANLLAAAPDMLEALKAIKALAPKEACNIHKIITDAINKAEGKCSSKGS